MITITAMTSRMWINPPPTWTTKNPRIQRMKRITAMVQSMMASSQEVSSSGHVRSYPGRGAHPTCGCALCWDTRSNMATRTPLVANAPRSEQLTLRSDIVSNAASVDSTERSHPMAIGSRVHYVEDRHSARNDRIGNQRPMTAPGHGLGAHDGGRLETGQGPKATSGPLQ